MNIGILEPDNFSKDALESLASLGNVSIYKTGEITKFVKDKHVLFIRLGWMIDEELLSQAVNLRYICSPTTGLNHINLSECKKKGIQIISLKGETKFLKSIRATPEHTLGLLIALKRNYRIAFLNQQNSTWNRDPYRGEEIYKSNIGIIGLGRVGSLVAKYLKVLGAQVSFYDINTKKHDKSIRKEDTLLDLISNNETLILCANYDSNQGKIVNKQEIDAMKDKYFINTARAELTDENYLLDKASKGYFKGIAIDVIEFEQVMRNNLNNWLKASSKYNVIVTPHIGGATFTSMCRTEEFITEKLSLIASK